MRLTVLPDMVGLPPMDDLELIKMRLSRTPVQALYRMAQESGVPYGTLWNLKNKKTKNPRYGTVKPLADFFRRQQLKAA